MGRFSRRSDPTRDLARAIATRGVRVRGTFETFDLDGDVALCECAFASRGRSTSRAASAAETMTSFTAQLVGGPTALLEYGGLRWLTDPALSPPGEYAGGLVKLTGPAVAPEALEPIDVVLLSHDQHSDNLDPGGRDLLPRAGRVLTTTQAAERLGGTATGLEPWSAVEVSRPGAGAVVVTAVPAQHGPDGCEPVMGPVTGFLLRGEGLETVYVSGDNASLDVVREIARRTGAVDVAVLFAGAVSVAHRFDGAYLTLSSERAADAAKILGARTVVPVHFEGWTHFTQGADALRAAFVGNQLAGRLVLLERGEKMGQTPHDGAPGDA